MTRPSRGFTLVELMIAAALLGILTLLFDAIGTVSLRRAHEELQRARAGELLRALTNAEASGQRLTPDTRAKLEAGLPEVTVSRRPEGAAVTFTVSWRTPSDTHPEVSLTTFSKGGAR